MKPTMLLPAVVLFSLVTVEFGGWSLLGLLNERDSLTPFQEQFFRAQAAPGALLRLSVAGRPAAVLRPEKGSGGQWDGGLEVRRDGS